MWSGKLANVAVRPRRGEIDFIMAISWGGGGVGSVWGEVDWGGGGGGSWPVWGGGGGVGLFGGGGGGG